MANLDEYPTATQSSSEAHDQFAEWRNELRRKVTNSIERLDPAAPDTLRFAVYAMLETQFKPKDLSALLGPSQTTIGRWAVGQTIPRSAPYRKWLVETLIAYLRSDGETPPG